MLTFNVHEDRAQLVSVQANLQVHFGADAFADAETDDNNSKDYVHIRIQQRNGKKSLTTVQVGY